MFFSKDGYTYDENHKLIENMQVLGTGRGKNIDEAFIDFKKNQSYLKEEYVFKNICSVRYAGNFIFNLEL